ncbi:hypothetical protein M5K25_000164 [Dendrobium thyrsiflorum]|uniref:Uncharacterized protein n=1 Tax=Dendrobium thyrsiflorum TaxID=117978 RepID=A0ABD0VSX6_DENTH
MSQAQLRASPTERQTCVCRRSAAPAERQFFRHLLAGEQCDANISVALFTYAIFLFQPDLPKKHAKDGLPSQNPKNGVPLEMIHGIFE